MRFRHPIFDPCQPVISVAQNWGEPHLFEPTTNLTRVLKQPFKVAAVHVFFNDPSIWPGSRLVTENPDIVKVDLSQFDLVLLMEAENNNWEDIQNWIKQQNIKNYIFAYGTLADPVQKTMPNMFYSSWWLKYFLNNRKFIDTTEDYTHYTHKPFRFNALLGARKPHRDYIMLAMTQSGLLHQNIVTYRDVFPGEVIDPQTKEFKNFFPDVELQHPYVSPHLRPEWEVAPVIDNRVSFIDPVAIHRNTWYSIVAESNCAGTKFFFTEKTMKQLWAKRVFVMFANTGFLGHLRDLGFETFGSVIDESYDTDPIYNRDWKRFEKAFEQVLFLNQQDPVKVYQKLKPVLDHNHNHMHTLLRRQEQQAKEMLMGNTPTYYWLR